jgi:hypothetical protein
VAITVVNKYTEGSATFATPFVTASNIAFSNNKLYLCSFYVDTDECIVSAISGGGITWVKIAGASGNDAGPGTFQGGALFRGYVTSGASTGKLTVTYDVGSEYYIVVDEIDGHDTSGTNGSGAIVQANLSVSDSGVATNLSVGLSAFGDANNVAYAWSGKNNANAYTPGSGYTELTDFSGAGTGRMSTEYKLNDTGPSNSWTSGAGAMIGAVEIKNGIPPAPPTTMPRVGYGRRAGN